MEVIHKTGWQQVSVRWETLPEHLTFAKPSSLWSVILHNITAQLYPQHNATGPLPGEASHPTNTHCPTNIVYCFSQAIDIITSQYNAVLQHHILQPTSLNESETFALHDSRI